MNSIRTQLRGWLIARGRQARQQVQRVSEQAVAKARQAGRAAAARVRAVQRAAGLPDKLVRRSVQSVASREPARPSDAAWRDGYLQVADRREPVPAMAAAEPNGTGPAADAEPAPELSPAARPGPDYHASTDPPVIDADRLRPLRFAPEARASDPDRMPPGHGRRIARGDFATPQEAREAADAWRQGAGYAEYLGMGTGTDREAGQ